MSYLVLARKYRPTTFDEVVGQEGVVRTLKNAIGMSRVAHAYLFTGARGVGKTTIARILARALNCAQGPTATPDNTCPVCQEIIRGASPDVFEIDGASNTGVDDVRQLRDNLQYMPARSRFKIYIIDEVHMLSVSAFNALLKTLEEPPAHVKFIFATTEPHKIPVTVLSRCQRFDFKRIPTAGIQAHLEGLLQREALVIEPEGLRLIARQAAGSMRDALSLTDQVLAFGGQRISTAEVQAALGLAADVVHEAVLEAVLDRQPEALMRLVERLFDEGHDLKRFLDGLLGYAHHMILFRTLGDAGELLELLPEERQRLSRLAARAEALRWHQVFDVLLRAAEELARSPFPRLILETALLRLVTLESAVGLDSLVQRLEALAARVGGGGGPGGGGTGTARTGEKTERRAPPANAQAVPARPAAPAATQVPAAAPAPAAGPAPAAAPAPAPSAAPPAASPAASSRVALDDPQ
ncbi:MAG TPA: DNA polymerase III subunit gamma/tau, partial [Myxococcota bacterium]|nr:DNA polymerase III subunit gamma/tau [Myxococcota bacterium]